MKLLAVSIPQHDANVSFFDGEVVRYLKLERTRQRKRFTWDGLHDWREDVEASLGVDADAVDAIAFTLDPSAFPAGVLARDFAQRLPFERSLAEPLPAAACDELGVRQAWLVSHHASHALSTWMLEERPADVRVVIDGLGDGRPWSVYRDDRLVAAGRIRNGSIGWGMREAGKRLGIRASHYNDIAGKLMGLQSYGRIDEGYLRVLERFGLGQLRDLWSPRHWVAYKGGEQAALDSQLDWVATVHHRQGEVLVQAFRQFTRPGEIVSYSGGVAQNVLWNARLREEVPGLVIPPHASDEGLSLGSLEWLRRRHGLPPLRWPGFPYAQLDEGAPEPSGDTIDRVAHLLAGGHVVGWYQGHGEVGPRALGNRSILMDPRLPDGRDRLNRVKRREHYRPFGASVLREHAGAIFDGLVDDFMLYACKVRDASFPAITHVDGTCRVQSVGDANPVFRRLLERFHAITGCAVLANTSLNVAGRPLAGSPADAWELFRDGALDAVAIGDDLRQRREA